VEAAAKALIQIKSPPVAENFVFSFPQTARFSRRDTPRDENGHGPQGNKVPP
jgi:hypothetical protein